MGKKDNLGYEVKNARSAEQAAEMQTAAKQKKCIFCDIDFKKNRPLNRLGEFDPEGKDWPLLWVWINPYSQEHQMLHLMIIPKQHINNEDFSEKMSDEIWLQILDVRKWACKFFNIPGGLANDRFGERFYNAGTIGHWHYQLQIPNGFGNVKATAFKDLSPIEEARRANRSIYSEKDLETVEGFLVFSEGGLILNRHFHWESSFGKYRETFVHTENSLPHIGAIFSGHEMLPEFIIPATFRKGYGTEVPRSRSQPFPFGKTVNTALRLNQEAYERDSVIGYIFEDSKGLFLTKNLDWEVLPLANHAYVHVEQAYPYIVASRMIWHRLRNIHNAKIAIDAHEAVIESVCLAPRHIRRGETF